MADAHTPSGVAVARPDAIDEALSHLSCLGDGARRVIALEGGLTNINVRVTTETCDVVVRISSKDSGLLAIDRAAEFANSQSAAASGAAPRVVEYVPEHHLLVVEYVDGRTLTDKDLDSEQTLCRVADSCRRLHGGSRFVNQFDMFDIQRSYLATVLDRGFRLPPGYLDLAPKVLRVQAALATYSVDTVPCNNDLLAANFVDDGEQIWIIDYEYAGNNDPYFELGNIWSEASLSLDHLETLVGVYVGAARPELVARARLWGLMSKYGWTLWASIQDATSPQDFDFWEWGMQKYDRAVAEFDGSEFERLLDAATQHTGGIPCPTRNP